jgi:hypothetical protein
VGGRLFCYSVLVKKKHDIRVIHKVIFCFTPIASAFAPMASLSGIRKVTKKFIESEYKM